MDNKLVRLSGSLAAMEVLCLSLLPLFCVSSLLLSCARRNSAGRPGIATSIEMSMPEFFQAWTAGAGGKGARVYFPTLEVFDSNGQLIYQGHNAVQNANAVRQMPAYLSGLKAIPNAARLDQVTTGLMRLPQRASILASHQPTIVSVFLQDCHSCSLQEDALVSTRVQELARQGINLIVIHVTRPS